MRIRPEIGFGIALQAVAQQDDDGISCQHAATPFQVEVAQTIGDARSAVEVADVAGNALQGFVGVTIVASGRAVGSNVKLTTSPPSAPASAPR